MPDFQEFNFTKRSDIDSTVGGDRSTVLLPYIEQHGGEADDGAFVFNGTSGDGPKSGDAVGVIAIIAPPEHDDGGIEWTYFTGEGRSVLEASRTFQINFPSQSGLGDDGPEESEYVLTHPMHAATDETQSSSANTRYVNPSSFQIVSAGEDAGSRLFVGNLTMHSEANSEPVRRGAWIADVTYEPAASRLESANNLKQLGIAMIHYDGSSSPVESDYSGTHVLDAGECSVDICAQNSPPASPEPVTHGGWGHFELVLDGHSSSHLYDLIV